MERVQEKEGSGCLKNIWSGDGVGYLTSQNPKHHLDQAETVLMFYLVVLKKNMFSSFSVQMITFVLELHNA